MGGILAILGPLPHSRQRDRIDRMAAVAPQRGALHTAPVLHGMLAAQARSAEAGLCRLGEVSVACHGIIYPHVASAQGAGKSSCAAEMVAKSWQDHGPHALTRLDGEFSLVVHDSRTQRVWACVSLSATKPLFWACGQGVLSIGSEARQVLVGANIVRRVDPGVLMEQLCFGGALSSAEETVLAGVHRMVAPRLYTSSLPETRLQQCGRYWEPPAPIGTDFTNARDVPPLIAEALSAAVCFAPAANALALSGGYDSGAIWIAGLQCPTRRQTWDAYVLTYPGKPCDERPAVERLLRATASKATFIDAADARPSRFIDSHLQRIDRVPGSATLANIDVLGEAAKRDAKTHLTLGVGAEAWVTADDAYAADLLRAGRLRLLIQDAHRYRYYVARPRKRWRDTMRFLKGAAGRNLRVAGSGWVPWKAPRWLHPRQHERYAAALNHFLEVATRESFARGEKWAALEFPALHVGTDSVEQLAQHYGLELYCPFQHRRLVEVGFAAAGRGLNQGRFPKHALLTAVSLTLPAAQSAWTGRKTLFEATYATDADLITALGAAQDWELVARSILRDTYAQQIVDQANQAGTVAPSGAQFSYAERFLRGFHGRTECTSTVSFG
jgi:asparagine synthetase B (glutamine-hydrolysing)